MLPSKLITLSFEWARTADTLLFRTFGNFTVHILDEIVRGEPRSWTKQSPVNFDTFLCFYLIFSFQKPGLKETTSGIPTKAKFKEFLTLPTLSFIFDKWKTKLSHETECNFCQTIVKHQICLNKIWDWLVPVLRSQIVRKLWIHVFGHNMHTIWELLRIHQGQIFIGPESTPSHFL